MSFVSRALPQTRRALFQNSRRSYSSGASDAKEAGSRVWEYITYVGFVGAGAWWVKVVAFDGDHAHGWPKDLPYMHLEKKDFPFGEGNVPLFTHLFPKWAPTKEKMEAKHHHDE